MSQQKSPKEQNQLIKNIASFSGVALQMGLTIYLGNLLGTWIDTKYGTTFWEDSITLLAVFLAMAMVIRKAIAISK